MTGSSPGGESEAHLDPYNLPIRVHFPCPPTCCHGDESRLGLRLRLYLQEAGEAEDWAGHADHEPSPVQGPWAALLRGQAAGPIRGGGERDVVAHLAVWHRDVRGIPPEGRLEGSRTICERGEGSCSCSHSQERGTEGRVQGISNSHTIR